MWSPWLRLETHATLSDHLREQLQMLEIHARQRLLCEEIIGNIGEDGYVTATAEQVLESVNQWLLSNNPGSAEPDDDDPFDIDEGESATNGHGTALPPRRAPRSTWRNSRRRSVSCRRFDPPGVGARDLRGTSCCCSRISAIPRRSPTGTANEAFPDLIAHRWNDLARNFSVEPKEAQTAADALSRFDPKPGRAVFQTTAMRISRPT